MITTICNIVKINQGGILCPPSQHDSGPMACFSVCLNPNPGTLCQLYCPAVCSQKTHFKTSQLQNTAKQNIPYESCQTLNHLMYMS